MCLPVSELSLTFSCTGFSNPAVKIMILFHLEQNQDSSLSRQSERKPCFAVWVWGLVLSKSLFLIFFLLYFSHFLIYVAYLSLIFLSSSLPLTFANSPLCYSNPCYPGWRKWQLLVTLRSHTMTSRCHRNKIAVSVFCSYTGYESRPF